MKTILAVVSLTLATVLALPSASAEEVDCVDSSPSMVNLVLSMLNGAQTVAICSFKLPEGMVIDKVIRGEPKKVGQLWNSTSFPQKPIVAFERTSDHMGDGPAELMVTRYFELDQTKKFIVLDSVSSSKTRCEKILVSLDAVEVALTKKKAEQAGTGQPATHPLSDSEGSDKPQPEAEGRPR